MFASQLLRILQTLPADIKYESNAFEPADLKVRMKENQNGIQRHSDGYREELDSSSFTTKNLRNSYGRGKDADPLPLQTREGDDFWNTPELERSAIVDDFTNDSETNIRVSKDRGKSWNRPEFERSAVVDDFTNDSETDIRVSKDRGKVWNSPELERSTIMNDFAKSNQRETRDSSALVITSSEFPADTTHLYSDKNVMECDLPELMVCYKEINYHVVKDICIDEGMPVEGKGLTNLHSDDRAGLRVSQPSKETSGGLNFALLAPNGSKASSEEDSADLSTDKRGTKEETDVLSLVPVASNGSMEVSVDNGRKSPEDPMQAGETNGSPESSDASEEESIITSMLPLKKFGTRSFLRSFMDSLKDDGDELAQQHNQMPSVEANLETLDAVSKAEESNKTGLANKLVYNSKVENGAITFDFNSPKAAAVDGWSTSAKTVELALKSGDVLNHNNGNMGNPLAANLDGNPANIHQQSARNSSNPFIGSEVQSTSIGRSTQNTHQESVLNHKKVNSNNPFAIGEVQSDNIGQIPVSSDKIGNFNPFVFSEIETASIDASTVNVHQPPVLNAKKANVGNPFFVSEIQNANMDESTRNIHPQPELNHKIEKTNNPFAVSEIQSSSMAGSVENTRQQPEPKHKSVNSNNPFAIKDVHRENIHENALKSDEMPDHRVGNSEIVHEQSLEPQDLPLPNHESMTNNIPFNDQGQGIEGEASFSVTDPVTGLITYAGTVTSSGSTSLRSDSSTTSTRSFAFPVLPSEWNSSPVRMGKADGRHFRKHRGWKRGILCCRA